MTEAERDRLLDELLEGLISEADFLRLEAEMHIEPAAREAYYSRLHLDTGLRKEAGSLYGESTETADRGISRGTPFRFGWIEALALAALLAFFVTLAWGIAKDRERISPVAVEPVASGYGVVAAQSDVDWSLRRGDLLPQGAIRLGSGIARIELFSGVTLIVEGDAEFTILSAMEVDVRKGKVKATVPQPCRGFRIRTEQGEIVDLGTEFVILVEEGRADLRVLSGAVEWHPPGSPMVSLRGGESLQWANGKAVEMGDLNGLDNFVSVENRLSENSNEKRQRWIEQGRKLENDPRLLAYYPILAGSTPTNKVKDLSPAQRTGSVVRSHQSVDRWGMANEAIDFSPMGSRIRVDLPGEYKSLTLSCWVRIDSLDRLYNSLFLTDGHELFEPHWQILSDGRIFFSVKAREATSRLPDKHIAHSPPIWTPADSGKWFHLATVYDGSAYTTTHYVNGEMVSKDTIPEALHPEKVRIGAASIGNWSDPTQAGRPEFAVRNLNGAIDDFLLFSPPLSGGEVRDLYESGRP